MGKFDKEQCPVCKDELYGVEDYQDETWGEDIIRVWKCICPVCHARFRIQSIYTLQSRKVLLDQNSDT